jgi:hypothetical protein
MNLPQGRIVPASSVKTTYLLIACLAGAVIFTPGCCWFYPEATQAGVKERRVTSEGRTLIAARVTRVNPTVSAIKASGGRLQPVEQKTGAVRTSMALKDKGCCVPGQIKSLPLGIRSVSTYITAGPNITFMNRRGQTYGNSNLQPGIGFQAGFASVYQFNDQFSVTPALLFKQVRVIEKISTGYEPPTSEPGSEPVYSSESKYTCSYNYLSVPVMAEYSINENLRISAGPEVNYLVKATEKRSGGGYYGGGDEDKQDITKDCVKLGVGVQVGVKYTIPNSMFGLQLIYDHRITPVNKEVSYEPSNYIKTVQLGITCAICNLLKGRRTQ